MASIIPLSQASAPTTVGEAFALGQRIAQDPRVRMAATRIAGRIGRSYRKRQSLLAKRRSEAINSIGQRPGTATSKKDGMVASTVLLVDGNELYYVDATALETDTGSVTAGKPRLDINKRQRAIAYVSGFRYRQYWRNNLAIPLLVRWAVLSAKDNAATLTAGFFRSYESSRDVDFSTSQSTIIKQTAPISRDKYTVFYEGKLFLAPNKDTDTEYTDRSASNINYIDKWLPLGRQLQFNDDTTQDCEDKVFFVWWATNYLGDSTAALTNGVTTQTQIVTHFRDPLEMMLSNAGYRQLNRRRRPTTQRNLTKKVH